MNLFFAVLVLILLALAVPPAVGKKSWLWFFVALVLSFAVVVLPLFVFFVSAFLIPDWKGACAHGWLDCFILGKLALAPLALVATAALYSVEVLRVKNRTKAWIVLGIFIGAIVSVICLVFGLTCIRMENNALRLWMLVPLYIAIWYSLRAAQLVKESQMGPRAYWGALLSSLPFWIAGVFWSRCSYAALPDTSPSCFIVTAAGRGHRKFVGPFFEIPHHGRKIQANQQLLTLWQFENLWRNHAPRSHKHFRRFYNRFGPVIAAQIGSPWLADLAYAVLKPVELAVKLAIPASGNNTDSKK